MTAADGIQGCTTKLFLSVGAIKVFIQNEAGSRTKHRHDEKTLAMQGAEEVSRPYPFPYGFVLGTTAADGMNVDCFVITDRRLRTGQIVECIPVGLMEQTDSGVNDHNVLARRPEDDVEMTTALEEVLTEFVRHVFRHVEDKPVEVGRFLGADAAEAHLRECMD